MQVDDRLGILGMMVLIIAAVLFAGCAGGGGSGASGNDAGAAPSALSYPSPLEATEGIPMTAVWPTVRGTVTSYSVAPALPAGLSINSVNGAIAGTPTTVAVWANYTITAINSLGSTTFELSLAVTGPSADGLAPSIPAPVTVTIGSPTELDVAWAPSTDNVGVVGYHVRRDGVLAATLASSPFNDASLTTGVQHCYTVTAFDAWRNESPPSNAVCGTPAHRPPVAVLVSPAGTLTGAPVILDASQSHGVDGALVSYHFDFGDGSPPVLQATPTSQHTYSTLGTFTVAVTVTDNTAAAATASAPLTAGLVVAQPVNVSRTPWLSQSASVFREVDGSIDAVWEESRLDLMFARSVDGGKSFSPASYVLEPASQWGSRNGFAVRQMQVAVAHGLIHVA